MKAEQFRALLWLRWRLTANQFRRGAGPLNALITAVAGVGLVLLVGVVFLGGTTLGGLAGGRMTQLQLRTLWDVLTLVFLFVWCIGVVIELQRAEAIDVARLSHFPISLRGVVVMNYLASHLSVPVLLFSAASIGLGLGLAWSRGWTMLLLIPASLAFLGMITAWTYCLRGWLTSSLVHSRQRRTLVMLLTLGLVLLSQLPNLFFSLQRNTPGIPRAERQAEFRRWGERWTDAHRWFPPLWVAGGAAALVEERAAPVLGSTLVMAALGAVGLWRAGRSSEQAYRGALSARPSRPVAAPQPAPARTGRPLLVERSIPGISEEAAAVATAGFRAIARAPEVKMMLSMNVLIFGMMFLGSFLRHQGPVSPEFRAFLPLGVVGFVHLAAMQLMFNQFGFDRDGFRALVLSPVSRRSLLLGRNLAFLPFSVGEFVILLLLLTLGGMLGPAEWIQAGALMVLAFSLVNLLGNVASIYAPYRIAPGTLKPTKTSATSSLLIALMALLFAVALTPLLIPPAVGLYLTKQHELPGEWVAAGLAALGAGVALLAYVQCLGPLGRLLQQREREILAVVTHEVE